MAITKETYTATATWTAAQLADLFRDAFIDAGLMTDWHDAFAVNTREVRVMKIDYDNTKTYGTTYYYLGFLTSNYPGVAIASGWNTATDLPTGTRFIDWHVLPSEIIGSIPFGASTPGGSDIWAPTTTFSSPSTNSNVFLDRFTSSSDTKQSWFVLRQGLDRGRPFSFLHPNTSLHPWLDLNKGMIGGFSDVSAVVSNRHGWVHFQLQENVRRCLLTGQIARGSTAESGGQVFHGLFYRTHSYIGFGSQSNSPSVNYPGSSAGGAFPLPVAKNSANPAFATDYVPICTNLPWSPFTPTALANDFGIYMHYADNTTAYGDKFIVQAGVNEWETLQFANNSVVVDGASPAFLARVV